MSGREEAAELNQGAVMVSASEGPVVRPPEGRQPAGRPAGPGPSRARLLRPWARQLARVVVSAALLGWLLHKLNAQEVLAGLMRLTPGLILFACGYYALCQLLSSYRWQLLLRAKGIRVPLGKLFSFYLIGMFLNHFLPGAVGGDVAKTYYLYRETRQGKYAVTSVFLERFTGLLGLSVLSFLGLGLAFRLLHSPAVLAAVGGTALFLLAVVLLLWWPPLSRFIMRLMGHLFPRRIGGKLQELYAALASYREHRKALAAAIGLSVGIQALYALYYALISQGLDTPISVLYFILFLPLVTVAIMVPLTFGGLGVREALMVLLFAEVGVPGADVLAVSLTAYFLNTLLSLTGGALLLLCRPAALPGDLREQAKAAHDPGADDELCRERSAR